MTDALVIIPAYDEEANVVHVIEKVRREVPEADILVVDDGSRDRTAELSSAAGAHVVSLPYNMGYATALQTGYKYARENGYQVLAQIDADGQHDAAYIPEMLALLRSGEASIVIGSRFLVDYGYRPPLTRRLGMLMFGALASALMGRRVTDPTSGFQALTRRAFCYCAGDVFPTDFADADVLIMLHLAGFRTREIPVRMYPSVNKQSRYLNMYSILTPAYYIVKMLLTISVTLLRGRGATATGTG